MVIRSGLSFRRTMMLMLCSGLGFFQSVVFVFDSCAQQAGAPPQANAPVDIQAKEQEFADDQVIARGNVKVTYKDSVITAPQATLFRDAAGQAQKAIFIGHPYLVQSDSKMNADTLIFEIANSKVVAQGHAHSEVSTDGNDTEITPKSGKGKAASKAAPNAAPAMVAGGTGKQPFKWPQKGEEPSPGAVAQNGEDANKAASESPTATADSSNGTQTDKSAPSKSAAAVDPKKAGPQEEKIITDSDSQEYDKSSGHFDAQGHVHVVHGDMTITSEKLQLVYGVDGKPETALFTGHVSAFQDQNNTQADLVTYYLATKRLQATGNVRSKVIQQKPADPKGATKKIGEKDAGPDKKVIGQAPGGSAGAASAAVPKTDGSQAGKTAEDDTILIVSDTQDYTKEAPRMSADGNVKVYYQDTVGSGPKAILYKNSAGRAEKVVFVGRSQVTQPGKRWIGDRITFAVMNKKVLAEGNTRAFIIQNQPANSTNSKPETGLASKGSGSTTLSTSKVEATR
jgi:lipopolysaccharide export system protein LptA